MEAVRVLGREERYARLERDRIAKENAVREALVAKARKAFNYAREDRQKDLENDNPKDPIFEEYDTGKGGYGTPIGSLPQRGILAGLKNKEAERLELEGWLAASSHWGETEIVTWYQERDAQRRAAAGRLERQAESAAAKLEDPRLKQALATMGRH